MDNQACYLDSDNLVLKRGKMNVKKVPNPSATDPLPGPSLALWVLSFLCGESVKVPPGG